MTTDKFRRYRVSFIEEKDYAGVASLHPQPPPRKSTVPDRRGGGNINLPFQPYRDPVITNRGVASLHPKPPPRKSTVPDRKGVGNIGLPFQPYRDPVITNRGVASLHPKPPPRKSTVLDRRGGGNIGHPLQSDRLPPINNTGVASLHPKPPAQKSSYPNGRGGGNIGHTLQSDRLPPINNTGVASLHPQPPAQKSSYPNGRGGGNIGHTLQSDRLPPINNTGPNPPPSRSPLKPSTLPDDMWHRAFAQSVQRKLGVVVPLLPPKPKTPAQDTWRRQHFQFQDGRYVKTPQGVPNYIADKSKRTWKNYTDLQLALENERSEKVLEERKRREMVEKENQKEIHSHLCASMESVRASILQAEAESLGVANNICEREKDLIPLIEKTDDLKNEIERLQVQTERISKKVAYILRDIPHELWDTVLKNVVGNLTVYKLFQRQIKAEPHFCEATPPEHCRETFLSNSMKEEVEALAVIQWKLCQEISGRKESLDNLKLDIRFISRQITNDNELVENINRRIERYRLSYAALQISDMGYVEIIKASG